MKKLSFFVLTGVVVLTYLSCMKSTPATTTPPCTNKDVTADSATLIAFAGDTIPLTHDTTGLYYHIIDTGSGTHPISSSYLLVTYVAKLMSNKIFDSATTSNLANAQLYNLIPGWQIGLPKIGVGGHIQLFIPSALAWGCTGIVNGGVTIVPPDGPVYFDVKLLGVN
jgi:FKBP-type peptidyl-prolyl cis-trans isomerase FkpA